MTSTSPENAQLAVLMIAAQGGDDVAYAQLLGGITPRLRRIVGRQRRFLNAGDIEDIVQDVLLSVHAVRATYDPDRPFVPWLMAIVRNRLADGARRHYRRAAHEVHADQLPVTFFDDAAKEEDEEFGDVEVLGRAVRALPPAQRQAIEMLKLKEMSLKEASASSGISVAALKVSVHRAMIALRSAVRRT